MELKDGKRKLEDNLFMTPVQTKKRVCFSKLYKKASTADVLPVNEAEDKEVGEEFVTPVVKEKEISMEVVVSSEAVEVNNPSGEDLEEIEGEEPCTQVMPLQLHLLRAKHTNSVH